MPRVPRSRLPIAHLHLRLFPSYEIRIIKGKNQTKPPQNQLGSSQGRVTLGCNRTRRLPHPPDPQQALAAFGCSFGVMLPSCSAERGVDVSVVFGGVPWTEASPLLLLLRLGVWLGGCRAVCGRDHGPFSTLLFHFWYPEIDLDPSPHRPEELE